MGDAWMPQSVGLCTHPDHRRLYVPNAKVGDRCPQGCGRLLVIYLPFGKGRA